MSKKHCPRCNSTNAKLYLWGTKTLAYGIVRRYVAEECGKQWRTTKTEVTNPELYPPPLWGEDYFDGH